jgi:hypothetical protein
VLFFLNCKASDKATERIKKKILKAKKTGDIDVKYVVVYANDQRCKEGLDVPRTKYGRQLLYAKNGWIFVTYVSFYLGLLLAFICVPFAIFLFFYYRDFTVPIASFLCSGILIFLAGWILYYFFSVIVSMVQHN